MLGTIDTLVRVQTPQEIVDGLPSPDYSLNYQPTYPDQSELLGAVHELQATEPVTMPEHVLSLRAQLAAIACGEDIVVVMDGRCAEPVRLTTPIAELAQEGATSLAVIAASGLTRVVHIKRCCGQCAKPRSNETETLPDGTEVVSYMGDAINDRDPAKRTPDPTRMVATALQARDVEAMMAEQTGSHIMVGHEALLLPYEQSFIREDPVTGRRVSVSGDLLWLGVRTNRTDVETNPHIDLLASIENPVGIKIGPDSDETHIAELVERLNPDHEAGKLVFMIRVGADQAAMERILGSIKQAAPESIIMYDIHGSTVKTPDGVKVRAVSATIDHIRLLAEACARQDLRLHGVHIETMGDDSRLECVDTLDERPTHKGDVDPQFNPRQTKMILDAIAPYLQKITS